jgi:phosphoribosylformylglycinamidine synthase
VAVRPGRRRSRRRCLELGIPVTGGNVSFYNQTGDTAILPTPVVGVLGIIDDVARRIPNGMAGAGRDADPDGRHLDEFDGSIWSQVSTITSAACRRRWTSSVSACSATSWIAASRDGLVSAAHDLSEGGLIQAVAELLSPVRAVAAGRCGPARVALLGVDRPCARRVPRSEEIGSRAC